MVRIATLIVLVVLAAVAICAVEGHYDKDRKRASVLAAGGRLVVFILGPLNAKAVSKLKDAVKEKSPSSVDIYTQSDTLRCNATDSLGGQLPSQKAGCDVIFMNEDEVDEFEKGKHGNMFGDQFNQAWVGDEWAALMQWIAGLRAGLEGDAVVVNVVLYPTQLSKNPLMDKILEHYPDPAKYKNEGYPSEMGLLQRYWLSWSNAKAGKREAVFDLGTVVDFVVDEVGFRGYKESLASQAQDTDWCVAAQPNKFTTTPMVYVDIRNEQYKKQDKNHCDSAEAKLTKRVKVAVPEKRAFYSEWVSKAFGPALKEAMDLQPVGSQTIDADAIILPREQKTIHADAIILQDSLDADNPISVVWLLKTVKFNSVQLLSLSEPENFKIHKSLFKGSDWATEHNWELLQKPPIPLFSQLEGFPEQLYAWPHLNPSTIDDVFSQFAQGNNDVAWPQLLDKGGKPIPQIAADEEDSRLAEVYNAWRWNQWLVRFGIKGVTVERAGYPKYTPLSHAITPYTFYFMNADTELNDNGFVRNFPDYKGDEKDRADQAVIGTFLSGFE